MSKKPINWGKFNVEIIYFLFGYLETYQVKKINDRKFILTRTRDGAQLELFPFESKGHWVFERKTTPHFKIRYFETYIKTMFL